MLQEELLHNKGSYTASTMDSRTPIVPDAISNNSEVDPQLLELGVETAVWLPVIGSYAARGVLILARCRTVRFSHADVDLLIAMTYRIGLALEQAQRSSQLEQIVRTGHEIGRYLEETSLCERAVQVFPAVMGAEASVLVKIEPDGRMHCAAQVGLDPEWEKIWCHISEQLLKENRGTGNTPYTTNLHPTFDQFLDKTLQSCTVRTLLAVPVQRGEKPEAFLYAMRFSTTTFGPDTLQIAMLFASQISAALENARLYQAVHAELVERNRAEKALRASDARFRALVRSVSDVISILAPDGSVCYASPAVEAMWGCSVEALSGTSILSRVHPADQETMLKLLLDLLKMPNGTLTGVVRLRQGKDNWRDFEVILTNLIDEPSVSGIVATYHDITERENYEKELTKLAYRDPLTGLSNRAHFIKKLQQSLTRASAEDHLVAVIFFDLDNFKIVNDSLGHDWGDKVLQVAADRVRACLRREDVAARFGGDEFTILIEDVSGLAQIIPVAKRLINVLSEPMQLDDRDLVISCSMGIAINTLNQEGQPTAEELLRKADLAMYSAKSNGKGCYSIFDSHLNAVAMERLELETDLRRALRQHELRVYYQPIVSLATGHIVEVEALVRWQHPQRGLVLPADMIPLAEETGLIAEIGQWVLEEAGRQVGIWQKFQSIHPPLRLSVNLSAWQFRHGTLLKDIETALYKSGLSPSDLTLEITEGSLIHDPANIATQLLALRNTGVRLAIDDFGTGYASLSFLKEFPFDTLKIGRSFVQGIVRDRRDKAIVKSMIELASAFDLDVIGEGIETENQATQLKSLGCNHGQGFLFAAPCSADDFEKLLTAHQ